MKSLNPRIEQLKQLMALEERRADLQAELDELIDRMSSLKNGLFDDSGDNNGVSSSSTSTAAYTRTAGRAGKRGRTPRGELKQQIVAALTAAGDAGVRVPELARALGIKPVNIHSWFHSAMRRYPEIKKMERGQYRLEGEASSALQQSGQASESSSSSGQRRSRSTQGGRRGSTAPHSRRGELSRRILEELTSAGSEGVNVRDLADKIGAPYKNIYIWFATTGKKNPKVKKLAPATYKLTA